MNATPYAPVLRKVLVIDDNPIIQRAVYFALRDKGFLVLMAGAISDAFGILRQQRPELVFLDLNFPAEAAGFGNGMRDGFAALEWMRRQAEFENIPIIIISGSDPEQSRSRVLAAGAAAFLAKPLDRDAVQAAALNILDKNRTARSSEQARQSTREG